MPSSPLSVRRIPPAQHLEFVSGRPSVSFLQLPSWGRIKRDWLPESLGWFAGSDLVGAGLALHRRIPRLPRSLAYLPEGPDIDWLGEQGHAPALADWLRPMSAHLRSAGAFAVKMGPPVMVRRWQAATIKDGIAAGASRLPELTPDETDDRAQRVARALTALGWRRKPDAGAGFGDVQPRTVFQVPLAGRSLDEVFAGFNQLWRRNVRKAEKSGVVVTRGTAQDLPAFHTLYVETARRDGFTPRGLPYFQLMWQAMQAEDPERLTLYLAHHEGVLLAATTMVRVGQHAWYSYGASADVGREVRPSNAVQWRMIRDAHAAGCRVYDLRGISDTLDQENPLFGLIQFKLGTGGYAQEYLGEWDLRLRPLMARAVEGYLSRR